MKNNFGKRIGSLSICLIVFMLQVWMMPVDGLANSVQNFTKMNFAVSSPPPASFEDISTHVKVRGFYYEKIDSALCDLIAANINSDWRGAHKFRILDDRVLVQIVTDLKHIRGAMAAVIRKGGEVTGTSRNKKMIQAWMPIAELETLAEVEDLFFIRRPEEVSLFGGLSETEALDDTNADTWHSAGQTGNGVKVAIIDSGFFGYSDLQGGDLPAVVTVKNFVDGETDNDVDSSSSSHGTACAEIVHDMAPDAQLFLVKVSTDVDLEEAVAWVITQGVQIISSSIGWYNITPGDGTGVFAETVTTAYNAGIFWATAASNDREVHWGGSFSDPDLDGSHNFNGDQEINYFGPGNGSAYNILPGNVIKVYVRWDDWSNVDQDFNLYLLRHNGASWDVVDVSMNSQNGGGGQTPTESCYVTTFGDATVYGFVIVNQSADRNVNFEVFAPKTPHLDEFVYARSLGNLADAPNAMTVAALDVSSPYPQESYSSEGPANGSGGTADGGAVKPDISAFANVSTESYGTGGFNGTSAATPHVAGAAALVLGANPGYTPAQVRSYLESHAVDMGTTGKDTLYGYGRLDLGSPPASVTYCNWLGGSILWTTAGNWSDGYVPTVQEDVRIPVVPAEGDFFPVFQTGTNAVAASVTIEGGSITVGAGVFTIN